MRMVTKDHLILFSGDMVKAILDGRKTQTRRVIKFPLHGRFKDQAAAHVEFASVNRDGAGDWVAWRPTPMTDEATARIYPNGGGFHCPYGKPGDRLLVRETWQYANWTRRGEPILRYRADDETVLFGWDQIPLDWHEKLEDVWAGLSESENYSIDQRAADRKWRPSLFMPRWAARLALRVVDVRVERLQEISKADAIAEGLDSFTVNYGRTVNTMTMWRARNCDDGGYPNPIECFENLWDSINAKRGWSWEVNPWVWVVEFEKEVAHADGD